MTRRVLVTLSGNALPTHGNGPQVGDLMVQSELASDITPRVPLGWCAAHTQATTGFLIMTALDRTLAGIGTRRVVASLIIRVLIDAIDPAWRQPDKPIGRFVSESEARRRMTLGQRFEDRGPRGWRRIVPSPEPLQIVDQEAVLA